jgi:hypothetical protein
MHRDDDMDMSVNTTTMMMNMAATTAAVASSTASSLMATPTPGIVIAGAGETQSIASALAAIGAVLFCLFIAFFNVYRVTHHQQPLCLCCCLPIPFSCCGLFPKEEICSDGTYRKVADGGCCGGGAGHAYSHHVDVDNV